MAGPNDEIFNQLGIPSQLTASLQKKKKKRIPFIPEIIGQEQDEDATGEGFDFADPDLQRLAAQKQEKELKELRPEDVLPFVNDKDKEKIVQEKLKTNQAFDAGKVANDQQIVDIANRAKRAAAERGRAIFARFSNLTESPSGFARGIDALEGVKGAVFDHGDPETEEVEPEPQPEVPINTRGETVSPDFGAPETNIEAASRVGQEAARHEREAILRIDAEDRKKREENQQITNAAIEKVKQDDEDIQAAIPHVDTRNIWNSKSTAGKIALALTYFFAGATDNKAALAILSKSIEDDIDAQKANIRQQTDALKKRTDLSLAQIREITAAAEDDLNRSSATKYRVLGAEIKELGAKQGGHINQQKADELTRSAEQKAAEYNLRRVKIIADQKQALLDLNRKIAADNQLALDKKASRGVQIRDQNIRRGIAKDNLEFKEKKLETEAGLRLAQVHKAQLEVARFQREGLGLEANTTHLGLTDEVGDPKSVKFATAKEKDEVMGLNSAATLTTRLLLHVKGLDKSRKAALTTGGRTAQTQAMSGIFMEFQKSLKGVVTDQDRTDILADAAGTGALGNFFRFASEGDIDDAIDRTIQKLHVSVNKRLSTYDVSSNKNRVGRQLRWEMPPIDVSEKVKGGERQSPKEMADQAATGTGENIADVLNTIQTGGFKKHHDAKDKLLDIAESYFAASPKERAKIKNRGPLSGGLEPIEIIREAYIKLGPKTTRKEFNDALKKRQGGTKVPLDVELLEGSNSDKSRRKAEQIAKDFTAGLKRRISKKKPKKKKNLSQKFLEDRKKEADAAKRKKGK